MKYKLADGTYSSMYTMGDTLWLNGKQYTLGVRDRHLAHIQRDFELLITPWSELRGSEYIAPPQNIYKYRINDIIELPKGARILHIAMQDNWPTLWALVDKDAEVVDRHMHKYMTGEEVSEESGAYIGTLCVDGGHIVHYFDGGEKWYS